MRNSISSSLQRHCLGCGAVLFPVGSFLGFTCPFPPFGSALSSFFYVLVCVCLCFSRFVSSLFCLVIGFLVCCFVFFPTPSFESSVIFSKCCGFFGFATYTVLMKLVCFPPPSPAPTAFVVNLVDLKN